MSARTATDKTTSERVRARAQVRDTAGRISILVTRDTQYWRLDEMIALANEFDDAVAAYAKALRESA